MYCQGLEMFLLLMRKMEGILPWCVGGGKSVGKLLIEVQHTYREVQTFSQTDHTSVNSIQLKKEIIAKNPIALLQEPPNHKRKQYPDLNTIKQFSLFYCIWLLSPNTMFSRLIHVAVYKSSLFFIFMLISHYMNI